MVIIFCTYIKESTLNARIGTGNRAKNWNHETKIHAKPDPEMEDNRSQF